MKREVGAYRNGIGQDMVHEDLLDKIRIPQHTVQGLRGLYRLQGFRDAFIGGRQEGQGACIWSSALCRKNTCMHYFNVKIGETGSEGRMHLGPAERNGKLS